MDALKANVALIVAVILLGVGGLLVAFLVANVGVDESTWQRYMVLLSGVEAVVFTAAGWLFGKEVHREQATKAEVARKEAEAEKRTAVENAARADTKGRELARAIIAAAGGHENSRALLGSDPGDQGMASLVRHARSAYPDV